MSKKVTLLLLVLILLLAAFLRLYRISDHMTFLGDEGRDVLVVKSMLEGDVTFLGPRSSAGNFFMGPAYYYMMTPFLWLFRYDPVGPAVMVALISVATVFLIYYVGKRFFNTAAGLFGAGLYAVSPLVITYAHSSWNPDILPFFSLLLLYITYKAIITKNSWKHILLTGFLLAIALQLHYLALSLIGVVVLFTFFGGWLYERKLRWGLLIKRYFLLLGGFVVGFSPFLAFEVRHSFINIQGIFKFIFGDTLQKSYETNTGFVGTVAEVFFRLFAKLLFVFPHKNDYAGFPETTLQLWGGLAVLVAIASIVVLFRTKDRLIQLLLGLWLVVCVVLFGFYKKEIFDYHFMLLLPLPFLLVGNLLATIYHLHRKKKHHVYWKIGSVIAFLVLVLFNLFNSPIRQEPNRQKEQTKAIAEFVLSKIDNKPFNFALVSPANSDHAYRYFFALKNRNPITIQNDVIDPQRKTVTEQLLVVCEDTSCKPLGHPLFEIAGFGSATISAQWDVAYVKVYKLIPYKMKKE